MTTITTRWCLILGLTIALGSACERQSAPVQATPSKAEALSSKSETSPSPGQGSARPGPTSTLPRFVIAAEHRLKLARHRPRPKQPARLSVYAPGNPVSPDVEAPVAIKLRGASSASYPQQSYSIEFRDANDKETDVALLDLPADADWVLVACWLDRTCMRNALAYEVAQHLGRWSPRLRWVEVEVDGRYVGLYQLVEAIRGGKHRLDLDRPAADPKQGDITGDYVFRREHAGKAPGSKRMFYDWISTATDRDGHHHIFTYHYPRPEALSAVQRGYLHGYVAHFETQMYASTGKWAAVAELIDVDTWVDYALVTEWAHEVDGWMKSVYFVKPSDKDDSRLRITPIWDYNLAFGQEKHRKANRTDLWQHEAANERGLGCSRSLPISEGCRRCQRGPKCGNMPMVPQWATQLFATPEFQQALGCRWHALRAHVLADTSIEAQLRVWHKQLEPAMVAHLERWPELLQNKRVRRPVSRERERVAASKLADLVDPYSSRAEIVFAQEVAWIAHWLAERSAWLDKELPVCASESSAK